MYIGRERDIYISINLYIYTSTHLYIYTHIHTCTYPTPSATSVACIGEAIGSRSSSEKPVT